MAKRKQSRKKSGAPQRPSASINRAIAAAMSLYEEGKEASAQWQLLQLARQHPNNRSVLRALVGVCQDMEDWRTCAYFGERLLALQRGEARAETLDNLVSAHIKLAHPALVWHFAGELAARHPDSFFAGPAQALAEKMRALLLQRADEQTQMAHFPQDEKLALLVLHDRARFYTESSHPEPAIAAAEAFLAQIPDFIPVLNNLSLSQFLIGAPARAVAAANKTLALDPANYHALANMVRFHFLTGQFDQARAYADRLEQVASDNADFASKQAEAFAFLGDDEKVWAAYERAQAAPKQLLPLLLHLAAVAAYRLGDEKKSWRLWRQALKQDPTFEMAQECLAEKQLPAGERNVPWYFTLEYWLSHDVMQLLSDLGAKASRMSAKSVERELMALVEERPYLMQLLPHLLERGNRSAREFALHLIHLAETPQNLQTLYDFARGRYGFDAMRMEAIQIIARRHPAMLPPTKQVPMWINGKQTEIFMLGFHISDEPEIAADVAPETLDQFEYALNLLLNNQAAEAEPILREVIAAAPHFQSAYNQLGVALQMQERQEEAWALVEETYARFPDYLFARVALARIYAQKGQIEEARALTQPLLMLEKLHISEFRALARAEMDISLANDQPESARSWLAMWRDLEDDNPELVEWMARIEGPQYIQDQVRRLLERMPK